MKDNQSSVKELKDEIYHLAKREYRETFVFNEHEFNADLDILFTTKKMLTRFLNSGTINEKLIINNIVITLNVFGPQTTTKLYRIILSDDQFSIIKAILIFLGSYNPRWDEDNVPPHPVIENILNDITMRYNL